ncbi:MAG: M23 family metallopeptidase [Nocardioides sp.]|uniref:M23 family metallopeptidase n=1 Tax=Nocardioides sp. TaxID=35761 RepID=UPI003F042329
MATRTPSSAGKRRAETPSRSPLAAVLPAAPLVAGVTVLAVSAGGAVAFADADLTSTSPAAANGISADAAASAQSLLASRGDVVSRSKTVTDVTDEDLLALAEEQAAERSAALQQVSQSADKRAAVIEENRWFLPLASYRLSATFGQSSYLWSSVHTGLDFATAAGTPIMAVANGTITETGFDGAYGNKTVLTLDDGTEIWFCHQTSFLVSVGDRVTGGEVIGTVGSTGNSTGNHLHLEVRPGGGDPVNPYTALIEHGVQP